MQREYMPAETRLGVLHYQWTQHRLLVEVCQTRFEKMHLGINIYFFQTPMLRLRSTLQKVPLQPLSASRTDSPSPHRDSTRPRLYAELTQANTVGLLGYLLRKNITFQRFLLVPHGLCTLQEASDRPITKIGFCDQPPSQGSRSQNPMKVAKSSGFPLGIAT